MLTRRIALTWLLLLALAGTAAAQQAGTLQRAVPPTAYIAVYARHNPERDFQKKYYEEVWNTIEETQLVQKVINIVTSRVPEGDLQEAKAVFERLKTAAEPIDLAAVADAEEVVYAQRMEFPTSHHLVLMRLKPDAAAGWKQGIANLFAVAEEMSEGEVKVQRRSVGAVEVVSLALPGPVPFGPSVAQVGDVLVMSTSPDFLSEGLSLLSEGGLSKFDDPRLAAALERLPEAEDELVFYDGRMQMQQMRGMADFIRREAGNDEEAQKVAQLVQAVFDEFAVFDYEISVGYTEDNLNRTAAYGRLLAGTEDRVLTKVLGSGQPFDNWQRWVPADAASYSLTTGVNLHPAYEWAVKFIGENVPDGREALDKFESVQDQIGVHLDRDILQAFSGECVSVALPASEPTVFGGQESVLALRCQKPDRVGELLRTLVEKLKENPFFKSQLVELKPSSELDGFDELSALFFTAIGVRPVIGFRDGWMIVGSSPGAVQRVLATRAGEAPTILESEAFAKFQLDVQGAVTSASYTDLAAQTRGMGQALSSVGLIMPMVIGMMGAEADSDEMKVVQEVVALLPSVGRIVAKFDFLEAQMSVCQAGDEAGTYLRRSVVYVRPESAEASASAANSSPR